MVYTPPNIRSLPFEFNTASGYIPPDFNAISADWNPTEWKASDLGSAIQVMQMYTETAYVELKECPTIIVGYDSTGVPQILKLPCIYTGIRDFLANIHGNPEHSDLTASIISGLGYQVPTDLQASIRIWRREIESDLDAGIYGWAINDLSVGIQAFDTLDLNAYLKTFKRDFIDVEGIIKGVGNAAFDLDADIHGYRGLGIIKELEAYLYSIPPSDLLAYLNVIERRDLPVNIDGEKIKGSGEFPSYVKGFWQGTHDLTYTLQSFDEGNLTASLGGLAIADLPVEILITFKTNLQAIIQAVSPVYLQNIIHGWATSQLTASLVGGYGPGHLQSYLNTIAPKDLNVGISGFYGIAVPINLWATIESYNEGYLYSTIATIEPAYLASEIFASGGTLALESVIFPKIVHVKQSVSINLLRHYNLYSVINPSCFASGYRNLTSKLYAFDNLNLVSKIHGRGVDEVFMQDLWSHVNTTQSIVEDILDITIIPTHHYVGLTINVDLKPAGVYMDELELSVYSSYTKAWHKVQKNLYSQIYANPRNFDLTSSINPWRDVPFVSEDPRNTVSQKSFVLNLRRFEERWRKEIDIRFRSAVEEYWYFSGNETVYRRDAAQHFVLHVEGYTSLKGKGAGIDKGKVRSKYIFDLSNYDSVDEAVRDAIERVSSFRRADLYSNINAAEAFGNYRNLHAHILSRYIVKTTRKLPATLIGIVETMWDLDASIYGLEMNKLLASSITGHTYAIPHPDSADFMFKDSDLTEVSDEIVDFNF